MIVDIPKNKKIFGGGDKGGGIGVGFAICQMANSKGWHTL